MLVRAAVVHEKGGPLQVETVELRAPGSGEVLVRLSATGLCHTDLSAMEGNIVVPYPIILGHEGAGVVVECGPDVATVAPGDHVILSLMPECGHCRGCRSEHTNYCEELPVERRAGETPFSMNGVPLARFCRLGTFAEYTVVKTTHVAKIRPDAPLDVMALVGCGVVTGVGSALNTAHVKAGSTVLVIGLGGIGLNVVQGARLAGAGRIIGVDANPDKERLARLFGLTDFVDSSKSEGSLREHLMEMTQGGVDFAFECVGTVGFQRLAFEVTHDGWGVCTFVGVPPAGENFFAKPGEFTMSKTIKGSSLGDVKNSHLHNYADWYMEGRLLLEELVSHRLPLERINEGYDLMRQRKSARTLVQY